MAAQLKVIDSKMAVSTDKAAAEQPDEQRQGGPQAEQMVEEAEEERVGRKVEALAAVLRAAGNKRRRLLGSCFHR